MRLYVKQLEIDEPDWWRSSAASGPDQQAAGSSASGGGAPAMADEGPDASSCDCKFELLRPKDSADGAVPKPRYEHGSLCIGSKAYVVGGRLGGRYLNDCWAFDLSTRAWRERKWRQVDQSNKTVLPALAAASYLHVGGFKCVVVGGHTKPDDRTEDMKVRKRERENGEGGRRPDLIVFLTLILLWSEKKVYKVDLSTMEVERCDAFGESIPSARGGHASVLVRSQVYVFGGEETNTKKLRNDLYVYDLHSSTWTLAETKGEPPSPRSAHSMTVLDGKYIVVFGGGSVSRCFNDVHVLDTQSLEWFEPEVVGEEAPEPRAGHASVLMSGNRYVIIGGGNNVRACPDAFVLDLSALSSEGSGRWVPLGDLGADLALSCEGATIVETDAKGTRALAYGGYDGKYLDRLCTLEMGGSGRRPAAKTALPAKTAVPAAATNGQGPPAVPAADVAAAEDPVVASLRAELAQVKERLKRETQAKMRLEVENAELRKALARHEDELPVSTMVGEANGKGAQQEHATEGGGGWLSYIAGSS